MQKPQNQRKQGKGSAISAERELELKLVCGEAFSRGALEVALKEAGAAVVDRAKVENADAYLDTRSGSLAAAGLNGRCRTRGGARKVQLKPEPLIAELVFERTELGAEVAPGRDPGRALKSLVERSLPIKLRGVPVAEVELRNRREKLALDLGDGACTAELCLDRVDVRRPGGRRIEGRFAELELELGSGDELAFEALARRLATLPGVAPSNKSKHRRARALLALEPHRFAAPSPGFGAEDRADEVARAVCLALLRTMRGYEPGTRAGLDPEHLHKMRVATRRLRAALVNFDGCFDRRSTEFLARNLKWLAAVLGKVRDLDVHQMDLVSWRRELGGEPASGWLELRAALGARWLEAREAMLKELASARYGRLCARAEAVFSRPAPRRPAGHPGARPVVLLAERMVVKRVRQLRKGIRRCRREGSTEAAHALRIVGKKLRYTAEFFRPLYPPEFGERIRKLSRFQDVLGALNDSTVAGELVGRLRDEGLAGPDRGSREYLYVLGRLVSWTEANATRAEARVNRAYEEVGGKRLLRFLARTAAGARAAAAAREKAEALVEQAAQIEVARGEAQDVAAGQGGLPPRQGPGPRGAATRRRRRR